MTQIYIDGASRGNPGVSSCAFVVAVNQKIVHEEGIYLGFLTNNQAEYSGLLIALLFARQKNYREVQILSDSELLVKQINGVYRVKSINLVSYFDLFLSLKSYFCMFSAEHISREMNKKADFLCNQTLNFLTGKESEKEVTLDYIRELLKRDIREP